jgi:hypothetical protein
MDDQKNYHVMRVRIPTNVFDKYAKLAKDRSDKENKFITISDLVRCAMNTYLQTQESKIRLETELNPKLLKK